MKAAAICPTSMLEWLQLTFRPSFHMALAQIYLEDPKYAKFFRQRRALGEIILLDQGAAELGAAIEDGDFIDVIRHLRPQLIVAPDVLHDGPATVKRTEAFLLRYRDLLESCGTDVLAVPQGKTSEECLATFETFHEHPGVQWLGISKFHYTKFGSREVFLRQLAAAEVRKPCHLLGVHGLVYDIFWEGDFQFVESVDTAKPIKLGLQKLSLSEEDRRVKTQTFFATPFPSDECLEVVRRNVEFYLTMVDRRFRYPWR